VKRLIEKGGHHAKGVSGEDRERAGPLPAMLNFTAAAHLFAQVAAHCGVVVITRGKLSGFIIALSPKHYEVSRDYFPFIRSFFNLY
jgi:hypothetical protein